MTAIYHSTAEPEIPVLLFKAGVSVDDHNQCGKNLQHFSREFKKTGIFPFGRSFEKSASDEYITIS